MAIVKSVKEMRTQAMMMRVGPGQGEQVDRAEEESAEGGTEVGPQVGDDRVDLRDILGNDCAHSARGFLDEPA